MIPFNGPIEIGLRALTILNDAYPMGYSLQRLVIFDYLIVHSDDIPNGPEGLHPQTPHRRGELLVRRNVLQEGLRLYQSRGLVKQKYRKDGIFFSATELSSNFLDSLNTEYIQELRNRAAWLVNSFHSLSDKKLQQVVNESIAILNTEFEIKPRLSSKEGQCNK